MEKHEEERLVQLKKYYDYFKLKDKYGWSFLEFTNKVDSGAYASLQQYL